MIESVEVVVDKDAQAMYIYMGTQDELYNTPVKTTAINGSVNLDFDIDGELVGVEILHLPVIKEIGTGDVWRD